MRCVAILMFFVLALPLLAQTQPGANYPKPQGSVSSESPNVPDQTAPKDDSPVAKSAPAVSEEQPRLDVEISETEVILGQPLVLRVKVLVPSFMPKPPVYPDLEQPNLLVRLPERSTTPFSERVDGQSWSGTSRAYRLYPLVAGPFELSLSEVEVTFADPDTNQPVTVRLTADPVRFSATLPAGAEGMSPPIIAAGFTLEQEIDGGPEIDTGGAITRRLSAKIDGTTALLIPQLTPEIEAGAIRAYPKEPRVSETETRGDLSGQRIEETVYVGLDGGSVTLPRIAIEWYNIDSGTVETAAVDGVEVTVAPPPPPPPSPARISLWVLLAGIAGFVFWRLRPVVKARYSGVLDKWHASELRAARRVRHALRSRDLSGTYAALSQWQSVTGRDPFLPSPAAPLPQALTALGGAQYGAGSHTASEGWRHALTCFNQLRKTSRAKRSTDPLPALNPGSVSSGRN